MKRTILFLAISCLLCISAIRAQKPRDFYQLKIYQINSEKQEARLDQYLESAYLPAMHRAGIEKVGIFKPIEGENESKNFIMVFIPFQSLEQFAALPGMLEQDDAYQNAGKDYIQAAHDDSPYVRIESILLRSFSKMPQFAVPKLSSPNAQRVYELRSYEGATELLYERKVEMFNDAGEVKLFMDLGFNPMFFGEVISGAHMPNLMYLTAHENATAQKENWSAFSQHPDWQVMKELERYKNTVSSITKYLLYPTEYSDL